MPSTRPPTLADYLAVIRRHLWLVVSVPVVAALLGFAVAKSEARLYQASAQVLVNRSDLASNITGTDPTIFDPARYLATEARIGRSRRLAAQVLAAAGVPGMTVNHFLANSDVTVSPDADVLVFSASAPDSAQAVRLANLYATTFTRYTAALATQRLDHAIQTLAGPLSSLRGRGSGSSTVQTLEQYQAQLETIKSLLADSNTVLAGATKATQVQPHTRRDVLIAGLVGAVLGVALAFGVDSVDPRVRSASEVEDLLGASLLARLPAPPRSPREAEAFAALREPESAYGANVRKLRTALALRRLEAPTRTILIASAVSGAGTSTTIANLGAVCAGSGLRVALVDLNVRRPSLHTMFGVPAYPGISDVIAGPMSLKSAVRRVVVPGSEADPGTLELVACGTGSVGSAVDLLASEGFDQLLRGLAEFDLVLIDVPPVLEVDDAVALTPKVDGVLLVLHDGMTRPVLGQLARELDASRAPLLGFVLTQIGKPARSKGEGSRPPARTGAPLATADNGAGGVRQPAPPTV
jgi:non-specific protein-tyrosine kinase